MFETVKDLFRTRLTPVARETIACMAPLLCATVLFAGIFLLSLVPTTIERSCSYAGVLSQLPGMPLEGFACAEFFFNRYQALIGVGTGFVIGVIAVYPVWLQVKLLARQTVLSGQSLVADAIEQTPNDSIQLMLVSTSR